MPPEGSDTLRGWRRVRGHVLLDDLPPLIGGSLCDGRYVLVGHVAHLARLQEYGAPLVIEMRLGLCGHASRNSLAASRLRLDQTYQTLSLGRRSLRAARISSKNSFIHAGQPAGGAKRSELRPFWPEVSLGFACREPAHDGVNDAIDDMASAQACKNDP